MSRSVNKAIRHVDPKHSAEEQGQGPLTDMSIVVWDPVPSRRSLVSEIIKSCGASATDNFGDEEHDYSNCHRVAFVALDDVQHESLLPSLNMMRALKLRGFKVISYADQIFSWAIATRCKALLAGATSLFDSSSPTFSSDLVRTLSRLLTTEAKERLEQESIQQRMLDLGIVGHSDGMISVFRWLIRVSGLSDFAVLISGETGTGKELIANAVHRLDKKRCHGPFIAANCSAIASGVAESELFGHRRGAFTGADNERKGLFRSAHGGVLFLDEISELSESMQAKLLRVLQEKRILGVGFDQEISVDVRVVAATNKSLEQMVKRGEFREDLYHRLNILSIDIPPLRDRRDDLLPLIEHFLDKYAPSHTQETRVNADFLEALMHLELPGNVRQLENIVRCAVLNKAEDTPLGLSDLPPAFWKELSGETGSAEKEAVSRAAPSSDTQTDPQLHFKNILDLHSWSLQRSLDYCERLLLQCALQSARGNQSQTARLIGITPRSVYNKLQKHKLQP